MKGTEVRVVKRNKRRNESESRALPVRTRKSLPPHLLEREGERIAMKIRRVHRKDQEPRARRRHHLCHVRKRSLEWLNAKRNRHLTVADLEIGHLLRVKVNDERGIDLHQGLRRSKGQQRGAPLLLPPLGDSEMERKRNENTKRHTAVVQEVTREEERGRVIEEGKGDSLHHMMSS